MSSVESLLYLVYGFNSRRSRLFSILFSFFNISWSGSCCGSFADDSPVPVLLLNVGFPRRVTAVGRHFRLPDFLVEPLGCGFPLEVGNSNTYLSSFSSRSGLFKGVTNTSLTKDPAKFKNRHNEIELVF